MPFRNPRFDSKLFVGAALDSEAGGDDGATNDLPLPPFLTELVVGEGDGMVFARAMVGLELAPLNKLQRKIKAKGGAPLDSLVRLVMAGLIRHSHCLKVRTS